MWPFKSKARRDAERRLAQTPGTVFPRFDVRVPKPVMFLTEVPEPVQLDDDLEQREILAWEADGVVIDCLGGNCPVQAEGWIDGVPFYFRARGRRWQVGIGADPVTATMGGPGWYYEEPYGDHDYAAGWMDEREARHCIWRAAGLYRTASTTAGALGPHPENLLPAELLGPAGRVIHSNPVS